MSQLPAWVRAELPELSPFADKQRTDTDDSNEHRRLKKPPPTLSASARMATHGVYLGCECGRLDDRCSAPGRHRQEIRVIGHHDERPDLGGKVEDQIVLMVGAIVNCSGHIGQDASAAVLCCSYDRLQVAVNFGLVPLEQVTQDSVHVGGDVGRQPERKLGGIHDDAQAVGRWVARDWRRRRPGPKWAVATRRSRHQDIDVVYNRRRDRCEAIHLSFSGRLPFMNSCTRTGTSAGSMPSSAVRC